MKENCYSKLNIVHLGKWKRDYTNGNVISRHKGYLKTNELKKLIIPFFAHF